MFNLQRASVACQRAMVVRARRLPHAPGSGPVASMCLSCAVLRLGLVACDLQAGLGRLFVKKRLLHG